MPAKQEKESAELKKKVDKLQGEKTAEEEKLKEVMESFKTETKVRITASYQRDYREIDVQ